VSPKRIRRKEALYNWLRKEYSQDLLSENVVGPLLASARCLLVSMKKKGICPGEQVALRTASGRALSFE
jgi:hypothetical protein